MAGGLAIGPASANGPIALSLDSHVPPGAIRAPDAIDTVQITVTARDGTIGPIDLEVIGHSVTFAEVDGDPWRRVEGGLATRIEDIPPGGAELDVTVFLDRPAELSVDRDSEAAITIVARAGEVETKARRVWAISDCAGRYHAALATVNGSLVDALKTAAKTARTRDASLPRRRAFNHTKSRRKKAQYAAIRFGATIAVRRGSDPYLAGDEGTWLLTRIAWDLERYLTQDANPAMCTGVDEMLEFLTGYAKHIDRRAERVSGLRATGFAMLNQAIGRLGGAVSTPPSASEDATTDAADWTPPPAPPLAVSADDLSPAVDYVRAMTRRSFADREADGDGAIRLAGGEDPAAERQVLDALAALRPLVRDARPAVADRRLWGLIREAAATIETAFYIDLASRRVDGVKHAIDDALGRIRAVHTETCTCIE